MVAVRKRTPTRLTVDEFLAWNADDLTGRRWQLVDGEPVPMAPARERHGAIQSEIGRLLANYLLDRGSENFRVPDLGVTCRAASDRVMTDDPVLLIEILSPSNESQTRSNIWTYTTGPAAAARHSGRFVPVGKPHAP